MIEASARSRSGPMTCREAYGSTPRLASRFCTAATRPPLQASVAGGGYLNVIAQPEARQWSWWGRAIFHVGDVEATYEGAASARRSLRPLSSEGDVFAKLGQIVPRECGVTASSLLRPSFETRPSAAPQDYAGRSRSRSVARQPSPSTKRPEPRPIAPAQTNRSRQLAAGVGMPGKVCAGSHRCERGADQGLNHRTRPFASASDRDPPGRRALARKAPHTLRHQRRLGRNHEVSRAVTLSTLETSS